MAERNFMLASSTLFVWFVFRMFLSGFRKMYYNDNPQEIAAEAK